MCCSRYINTYEVKYKKPVVHDMEKCLLALNCTSEFMAKIIQFAPSDENYYFITFSKIKLCIWSKNHITWSWFINIEHDKWTYQSELWVVLLTEHDVSAFTNMWKPPARLTGPATHISNFQVWEPLWKWLQ